MKVRVLFVMLIAVLGVTVVSAQVAGSGSTGYVAVWGGSASSAGATPFSADVVNITDRVLADGNRIHQETRGKTMRDSQGRTREEMEVPAGVGETMSFIVINDPVRQQVITLDARTKTAQVHHFKLASGGTTKAGATSVATSTGVVTSHLTRPQFQEKSEQLGTRDIEGFAATGTRFTTTIPAGMMGNEQPITSTVETWCSSELGTVILSSRADPQTGTTTRKLENIQRAEPDSSLFEVPADYTVNEPQ